MEFGVAWFRSLGLDMWEAFLGSICGSSLLSQTDEYRQWE
jgi:hypothetical protein